MEPRVSIITLGVEDLERSYRFYKDGLGLPTTKTPGDGIIFFQTSGVCLALYPFDKLLEDIDPEATGKPGSAASKYGITIAHNTKTKDEVDAHLKQAEKAGGKIVKPARDVFWGGYSGYFSDPDGYLWEIAYADLWQFNPDGSLVIE